MFELFPLESRVSEQGEGAHQYLRLGWTRDANSNLESA